MAYRYGEDPNQALLFPQSLDEYVCADHPVRAYSAVIEALDFGEMGIELNPDKVGNTQYHPKIMTKLIVYGCSYGVRSSRKLERETHNNVTFMWLMRNLKPDHKTIAEFRRNNTKALQKILKLCARLCMELDLIDGNILFVDGSKVRANASREKNHTSQWCEEQMQRLDARIKILLEECENIDIQEENQGSLVKMHQELANTEKLKEKIETALEKLKERGVKTKENKDRTINITDPDSAMMKSRQGSHASHNMQSVVDDKHGLIVHADAVSDTGDVTQFANQIQQAEEVTEKECSVACADAGYSSTDELEKADRGETKIVVPSQRQALHQQEKPFDKSTFTYDKKHDCYYCPKGNRLNHRRTYAENKEHGYQIAKAITCINCEHYGICTTSKRGRTITRLANEASKEKFEQQYNEPSSQIIYKRRKQRVEHPFGHIKRNLGMTHFMQRGSEAVKAEVSIAATCFNIARMITLFGGTVNMMKHLASVHL